MSQSIEQVIIPRTHDIGGFEVKRALPFRDRRMVGPFIFWDQAGPGEFLAGSGVDVRPHPHIGLSTVTYLFEGSLNHKDSLGNDMTIQPGDVNLMTAGRGIVHSERTGQDVRQNPSKLFGIQSWIALPKSHETIDPKFEHFAKQEFKTFDENGVRGRILMGNYEGLSSPIIIPWDTLYLDIHLEKNATFKLPAEVEERAIYALGNKVRVNGIDYNPEQMLVVHPKDEVIVEAAFGPVHLLILGGAVMDGPRKIWWNFVASNDDLMEAAKDDWKENRFPAVPGDDEFIPLPE